MYKEIAQAATRSRQKSLQKHHQRTHVRNRNFHVGAFVLVLPARVAVPKKEKSHKEGLLG